MAGSDKKVEAGEPTSKSLSNLIGVIESFRLLHHWAYKVNKVMKSAPNIMMWAITLALIGHSGLDEDKCLGLGREKHCTNTVSFYLWERRETLTDETLDVIGLESSIIFQTFCAGNHTEIFLSSLHRLHTNHTELGKFFLQQFVYLVQKPQNPMGNLVTYSYVIKHIWVHWEHKGVFYVFQL